MNSKDAREPTGRPSIEDARLLARVVSWVAIVWLLFGFAPMVFLHSLEQLSQFGDSFGFVNALFSGMALAGVIYAIILQRRELALQRQDLALTRRELHRSAEAQERSETALEQQAKALLMTARLSAIRSMAQLYAQKISLCDKEDPLRRSRLERRFEMYREQIEIMLDGMQPTPFHLLLDYLRMVVDEFEGEWNSISTDAHCSLERLGVLTEARSELATLRCQSGLRETAAIETIEESLKRIDSLKQRIQNSNGGTLDPLDVIREGNAIITRLKSFRAQSWE